MQLLDERISDAAANGDIATLKDAFAKSVSRPDATYLGVPLLSSAAWSGHHETVLFLLNAGARANQKDNDGMTPLMYAAQAADDKSTKILMDFGADEAHKDRFNKTAKAYALQRGAVHVLEAIEVKKRERKERVTNIIAFPRAKDFRFKPV